MVSVEKESGQLDGREWDHGVFLVDKPAGKSSFAIVRRVRKLLGIKKVGHAGTLDPFATGLLVICAGRKATRCIDQFMIGTKSYLACLQLGVETDTLDPEGQITATSVVPPLTFEHIQECLQPYLGPQLQAPPAYSAAKYKGRPLYSYARKGIEIKKAPKPIEIYSLVLQQYDATTQQLQLEVVCSRGTYIRVLAADIGRDLGCGAHLVTLRRIASGSLAVDSAISGEALFSEEGTTALLENRRSIEEMLDFPPIETD